MSYIWSQLLLLHLRDGALFMGGCSWGLLMEVLLGVKAIPWLAGFDVVGARCCWAELLMAKPTEPVL